MEQSNNRTLWQDRKRHFGLPISFTKYKLTDGRLHRETGLLNLKEEEVLLYRVRDLTLKMSLWQRIFGVGTVEIDSSDTSTPKLLLENVKTPREVKEKVYLAVESAKEARRMRTTELLDDGDTDNLDS